MEIIRSMGEPRNKTTLTIEQLRQFSADLRICADSIDKSLDLASDRGVESLDVLNHPSGLQGIDKFTKFSSAIHGAAMACLMSKSIDPVSPSLADANAKADQLEKPEPQKRRKKAESKS